MSLHILRHLPDDCMRLQKPADTFSCFWGENTLKSLKSLVKTAKNPLANLTKALQANGALFTKKDSAKFRPRFLHKFASSDIETYYRGVQTESFRLVGQKNNPIDGFIDLEQELAGPSTSRVPSTGCLLRNRHDDDENAYFYARSRIYKAVAIIKLGNTHEDYDENDEEWKTNVVVEAHKYRSLYDAYYLYHGRDKVPSSKVGIWFVRDLTRETTKIPLLEVKFKCVSHLIGGMRYMYKLI